MSSRVLDAGHGVVGFSGVRPPVFWPDLPVIIFWNGNVYSVSLCMLEVCKSHSSVLLYFPKTCSKDIAFNLTRSFGLLNNVENVKTT